MKNRPQKHIIKKLLMIFTIALAVRGTALYFLHDSLSVYSGAIVLNQELAHNINAGIGRKANPEFVEMRHKVNRIVGNKLVPPQTIRRPGKETYRPIYHYPVGYQALLSLSFLVSGKETSLPVQVTQIILDSFSVFFIFFLAKRFFIIPISLLSSFLYAIYMPIVRYSTVAYHDGFVGPLIVMSSFFIIAGVMDNNKRLIFLSGLPLGLLSLFRSDFIFFPLFLSLIIFLTMKNVRKALLILWSYVVLGGFLLGIGFINWLEFGHFNPTNPSLWHTMYIGFGQYKNPIGAKGTDSSVKEMVQVERPDIEYHSFEYESYLKTKVLSVIKNHPFFYLRSCLTRLGHMVISTNNWGFSVKNRQPFTNWFFPKAFEYFFLIIGLIGVVKLWKEWKQLLIFMSPYVYNILFHAPIYFESRYLVATFFPILVLGAFVINNNERI